jgi:hypothetical protein
VYSRTLVEMMHINVLKYRTQQQRYVLLSSATENHRSWVRNPVGSIYVYVLVLEATLPGVGTGLATC